MLADVNCTNSNLDEMTLNLAAEIPEVYVLVTVWGWGVFISIYASMRKSFK